MDPRPRRVCVDLTPLEMLDRHGGIGRYAVHLLECFSKLPREQLGELELFGLASSSGSPLPAEQALEAVRELPPEISVDQHHRQRRWTMGRRLRQAKIALFHSVIPYYLPLWPGCQQVATVHDVIPLVHPNRLGWRLMRNRLRLRAAFYLADHFIADSELTRQDMVRELGIAPSRISVVHLGVDKNVFSPGAPEEARRVLNGWVLPPKFFLCVSSDHYRKNHRLLFEAWCNVADSIPEGLVFIGRALYERTFGQIKAEAERRGIASRFFWLNDVDDAMLPHFYRLATAVVAPSLYEGFGMTLLEGMGCGTPVLAARNGVYEEVASDAAEFFDPRDRKGLETLLRVVSTNPELRIELRRRGHERVRALSWERTAELTLQVYRQLLSAG